MLDYLRSKMIRHTRHLPVRVIKFIITGVSAASVEYIIFVGLQVLTGERYLIICQSVSFMCGFVVSFLLNKRWVFRSSGRPKEEIVRYSILALINLFISNIVLWAFVMEIHIVFWLAKFLVMATIATWNYFIYKRIVFSNKKS